MARRDDFTALVTHAIPSEGLTELQARCRVLYPADGQARFSDEEVWALLPECDAVLACAAFGADRIGRAGKLKIISNYGAGYDRVDWAAAASRGIYVTNIPDSVTEVTAELTLALILAVRRRICELDRRMRAPQPEGAFGMGKYMGRSLIGSTLGVVGMGRIGGRVAQMGRSLGMNVVYHNRRPADGEAAWLPLDELMAISDVVTLHCPLTGETAGLIGDTQIARMKPDAIIVNAARGGVMDYGALLAALRAGKIAGAGLDVFPDEPHLPEGFAALDQVVLTPHVGSNTAEARRGMARDAADRILAVLDGRVPPNVVNGVGGNRDV
ncbi:MAG: hypothetical protein GX558_09535 [Clostridiales bacterium]|nr:hypothetical protein [Clostridiales bacterium]